MPRHLFQSEDLADVDLVIKLTGVNANGKRLRDGAAAVLQVFPAHKAILDESGYLRVQRYAEQTVEGGGRPAAVLRIEDADQLPAAEAVVGSMYGASTLLDQLSDTQVVDAVQLADMLQIDATLLTAMTKLKEAAASDEGLSDAAHDKLLHLWALPEVLQQAFPAVTVKMPAEQVAALWCRLCVPDDISSADDVLAVRHSGYVQQRLLEACGNLRDVEQRATAAALPTPALALLLASDQIKVDDEETVLWVVVWQHRDARGEVQKQAVQQLLEPLVRCPYLSARTLAALIASGGTSGGLLQQMVPKLAKLAAYLQLMPLRRKGRQLLFSAASFKGMGIDMPASWGAGCRQLSASPAARVTVKWTVPVSAIRGLVREFVESGRSTLLVALGRTQRPIGQGVCWNLVVGVWRFADSVGVAFCTDVQAFCGRNVLVRSSQSLTVNGEAFVTNQRQARFNDPDGRVLTAVLRVGSMDDGWNPAAWAASHW